MTLAVVAIITLLLIAFMTLMQGERWATASYGQSTKAEQLGLGGLRLVVGELQNEMAKDAPPDLTYPGNPLYTNITSANIEPQPVGTNSAIPTLVKISTNAPAFTGLLFSGPSATSISSVTPSVNGRYVSLARWNQACFGTFPTEANTPYWMMMTRGGPTNFASGPVFGALAPNSVNNPAAANTNYVIGRIAYAIYDEGGLLDINVAGHPSALPAAQLQAIKGTLAGANVAALGLNGDQLTAWRNQASATSFAAYTNYVSSFIPTNSAGTVYPGDNTFLGRLDLIAACQNGTAGLSTSLLPSLTTFTRERNTPSWRPLATTGTPTGCTIDYAGTALSSTATNNFVSWIRYPAAQSVTSYHLDGTSYQYNVTAGDPLVYRRFPLGRLQWLGASGPQNGGTSASIQACFGLVWGTGTSNDGRTIPLWRYVGATGTTEQTSIETLSQVLAEKREPNFFELLQAGILSGSLAHAGGGPAVIGNNIQQASQTLNILRIGASIMTQSDASGCPAVIEFSSGGTTPWQACGIANLPYLNMEVCLSGKDTTTSLECYFIFGLWNPTQGAPATRPPVRLRVAGSLGLYNGYGIYSPASWLQAWGLNMPVNVFTVNDTQPLAQTAGNGVNGFADPHIALPADFTSASGSGTSSGLSWASLPPIDGITYAGYRLPDFVVNSTTTPPASDPNYDYTVLQCFPNPVPTSPTPLFSAWLEFQNPAGTWIPYNYWSGINDPATWYNSPAINRPRSLWSEAIGPPSSPGHSPPLLEPINASGSASALYPYIFFYKWFYEAVDPRTLRFTPGESEGEGNTSTTWFNFLNTSATADPNFGSAGRTYDWNQPVFTGAPLTMAGLCRNNSPAPSSSPAAYSDPDGVQRIADSGLFPGSSSLANGTPGNPYQLSTVRSTDRPIILNRPMNSVAELGYTSRDYPWRSLDFFTAFSADAGLLDLFTVDDNSENVVAGRIDLNAMNQPALSAILTDTQANTIAGTALSNPSALATDMVNLTHGSTLGPLLGRSEIATKLIPALASGDFANGDEQNIKAQREGVARALADVGQTRTWNLMIDLVAQTGEYPPTATSLSQFVVEGERHYWLHVAIDRFTNKVIDQQLEIVNP